MTMQKKILLLGGSSQQIVAIETARRLGYYTVLCDYLPDNPGQYHADRFYQVSTTDKQAILEIAEKEKIEGIVAYASDPAAPTAAFVAEQLGLPGNPADSVETLCNKDRFRAFLKENGFHTPVARGYSEPEPALLELDAFRLPVIIKPVDSSGSKGATVLHDWSRVSEALEFAFSFSRSHRLIIEEFIEKKHPYLVGGDIFVVNGEIVLWGLLNCHRDSDVNPLVPVGKSYPLALPAEDVAALKHTLQGMVDKLHIRNGAMNVELVIDRNNRVWPIDVGPRNGGNMIPDLLACIFGVDVVELTIRAAMGENVTMQAGEGEPFYATHNLHSRRDGSFSSITYSRELSQYIIRECVYKNPGDPVNYFDNAAKALGILFLKFPDGETMERILSRINDHITIHLN
ncbi:MAG: ATP-grasp domain-containing protein [Ruminococcaceae bacterium]|nr:ATP-grasp domain-containing protein [Oscillospiraceae bacterium]